MSVFDRLFTPAGRSLAGYLDRTRARLEALAQQLRESVSTTLGHGAAEVVRQAVTHLVRVAEAVSVRSQEASCGFNARRDLSWAEREDDDRLDEWDDRNEFRWGREDPHWRDARDYEPDENFRPTRAAHKSEPAWRSALAAGCRILAWLLGRLATPGAGLIALGSGLATALAVYLVGSNAGPGSLGTLTDALSCGADTLARLGRL
jgi:hypothetical protein